MSSAFEKDETNVLEASVCELRDSTSDVRRSTDAPSLGSDSGVTGLVFLSKFVPIIAHAHTMDNPAFINICVISDPD